MCSYAASMICFGCSGLVISARMMRKPERPASGKNTSLTFVRPDFETSTSSSVLERMSGRG